MRLRYSSAQDRNSAYRAAFPVPNAGDHMAHASNIVLCAGPDAPHALDNVPIQPRNGALDALCPICRGHGQWNAQIDLVTFRCIRALCDHCHGYGWVETGSDPVAVPDIVMAPEGYPKWIVRYLDAATVPGS
ncbi:hypothetical protein [Sphingomonas arantia]|uniref:hypothetical protein n=1 Tax=Sphingomonas arantia TaxID=1460676 RepID=UPI0036D37169